MTVPAQLWYWDENNQALQELDFSMINPYTGEEVGIDGAYYYLPKAFQGSEDPSDELQAFLGDAIFLTGLPLTLALTVPNTGPLALFSDIETFTLFGERNIFNFAHSIVSYGDIRVSSSDGDDIIWTNIGNDTIFAAGGNDIINSGPGNDYIFAGAGGDEIRGGTGIDLIYGEGNNDTIYFSADNTWSAFGAGQNMTFAAQNAWSGDIVMVSTSNQSHDYFDGGSGLDTLVLTDDNDAVFLHDPYSPFSGNPNSARISGIEKILAGDGNDIIDLTSTLLTYEDVMLYGEDGNDVLWSGAGADDLYGGNGNDYLDGGAGSDLLVGGAGDDIMYGRDGNDFFFVGEGADHIHGGPGKDTIVYDVLDNNVDHIYGFETGVGKDVLSIYDILEGYNPATKILGDFVKLVGGTDLQINADGDKGGAFTTVAIFDAPVNDTLQTLINNGNLIV